MQGEHEFWNIRRWDSSGCEALMERWAVGRKTRSSIIEVWVSGK
jgi:hypothetical protein